MRFAVAVIATLAFAAPDAWASSFTVLHTFPGNRTQIHMPSTGFAKLGGELYSTTVFGNANDGALGTVFRISLDGKFHLVHSFTGGAAGGLPANPLLAYGGALFGTSTYDTAIVYSVSPTDKFVVLHSFTAPGDGSPIGSLAQLNGVIYGITYAGGTLNQGTVFSVTPQGAYAVVHSFGSGTDGTKPQGGLIAAGGILYGTTSYGGAYNQGTVFAIASNGTERVIYSFKGGIDGFSPTTKPVFYRGKLFGTSSGTTATCAHCDLGYSLTLSGHHHVFYVFAGAGENDLTLANGIFYGTTQIGNGGDGSAFSLTPSGVYTTLHTFGFYPDGAFPNGQLVFDGGTLYGTASIGGRMANGNVGGGTVFAITP